MSGTLQANEGERTVRSETTKDKADALPPAVYEKAKT